MQTLWLAVVMLVGSLTAFERGTPTNPAHRASRESGKTASAIPLTLTMSGPTTITTAGSYGYTACSDYAGSATTMDFWVTGATGQSMERYNITDPNNTCRTKYLSFSPGSGGYEIYAVVSISGVTFETSNHLLAFNNIPNNPPPPGPLSTYVSGPSDVNSNPSCRPQYTANTSGGTGSYSFSWSTDGTITSNDGAGHVSVAFSPGGHSISVTVNDGVSSVTSSTYEVEVSSGGTSC